jgi:hypothetical protein
MREAEKVYNYLNLIKNLPLKALDSPHDETSVHGLAHAVVRLPVGQSCLQTIQKCLRMRQRAQAASIRGCFYTE